MIRLARLAFLLLLALVPPNALAQDLPSETDWRWLQPEMDAALGTGRSGVAARSELGEDLVVLVTPEKGVSRATGKPCSNCTDPCRKFLVDLDWRQGDRLAQYEGRACAISGNYTNWTLDGPLKRLRVLVARPPGPDPALAVPARGLLAALAYLEFGASEEALAAALDEFRRDAKRGRAGTPLGEADVTALRETFERSRAGSGDCGSGTGTRFVACGTAAD